MVGCVVEMRKRLSYLQVKQVQIEHIFAIFEVIKTGCIVVDQDDRNHLRTGTHLGVVIKLHPEEEVLGNRGNPIDNETKTVHRKASFLHEV